MKTHSQTIFLDPRSTEASLGISILTGESCAYSMRTLCDINDQGAALIRNFFGAEASHPNWNSTVASTPAVNSVVLTPSALQALWTHAMINRGGTVVTLARDRFVSPLCAVFGADVNEIATFQETLAAPGSSFVDCNTQANPAAPFPADLGVVVTDEVVGLRQRCTLNPQGRALVLDFLGLIAGDSIWMTRDILADLYAFAALKEGWTIIQFAGSTGSTIRALWEPSAAAIDALKESDGRPVKAVYRQPGTQPRAGSRNIHLMTARAA